MERDAMEKAGRSALITLPEPLKNNQGDLIHVTAAAAVKAAATALLTNQVVRRVRVSLLDGRTASFKVDKCILESRGALCSVVGTRNSNSSADDVPEVRVRVAWEEEGVENPAQPPENSIVTIPGSHSEPEILWLQLDTSQKQKPSKLTATVTTTELEGPAPLRQIPLFLHFGLQEEGSLPRALQEIPRELLGEAVREALVLLPDSKWGQGVRVFVSLVNNVEGLPNLKTGAKTQQLFTIPPTELTHLGMALDSFSSQALPVLFNEANELLVDLPARGISLRSALAQVGNIIGLDLLTIGGGPAEIIALARGDLNSLNVEQVNNEFLATIAQRRDLDSFTIQSLRNSPNTNELIRLLSRRRIGWLLDEVCRLACIEVRKHLTKPVRLELITLGSTGAVLGRALIEPATFHL
ncbi:MAG: hypothetical protein WCS37_13760 [Chloroflexota bacterium]|nr:hypothetical protein [Chloroflexota bacterium]